MRIGSVSGIAGRGDFSLIRPVPDAETLPFKKLICIREIPELHIDNKKVLSYRIRFPAIGV